MKTTIFKDYSSFLNREDRETNGVSESFAALHQNFQAENKTNKYCWNCSRCSRCSGKEGNQKALTSPLKNLVNGNRDGIK